MLLPYELNSLQDSPIYTFVTDNGTEYVCRFTNITGHLSEIIAVHDIEVFEFSFEPNNDARGEVGNRPFRFDARVSLTISHLINTFFEIPNRVLYYMCLVDGKEMCRNSLFSAWFSQYNNGYIRMPIDIEVDLEDDIIQIYGCSLMKEGFEHADLIREQVRDNAQGIIIEKFN